MILKTSVNGNVKTIQILGSVNKADISTLSGSFADFQRFAGVLVDLGHTSFINSSFINLLIRLKNQDPAGYQRIKLLNPNSLISELLNMTHLDELYEVYEQEICLS